MKFKKALIAVACTICTVSCLNLTGCTCVDSCDSMLMLQDASNLDIDDMLYEHAPLLNESNIKLIPKVDIKDLQMKLELRTEDDKYVNFIVVDVGDVKAKQMYKIDVEYDKV